MSFQCRVLACLALGLVFISQNIGIYMLKVSGALTAEFILVTVIHSMGMLVCALVMPPLLARGRGFLSPVPLVMALTVPIILASHISGWRSIPAFSLRAMYVGMFWLFALHAFFRCAPPLRRGVLLGLIIAVAELVWIMLLPVMGLHLSAASAQTLAGATNKLQMVTQCAVGIALAAFFTLGAKKDAWEAAATNAVPSFPSALPSLFAATALLYIACGLIAGLNMPKVNNAAMPDTANFVLLIAMPLAGALLDRGGRMPLACLAAIVPAMFFARRAEAWDTLYILNYVGRWAVLLAALVLASRLTRNKKRLPLVFVLVYAGLVFAPLAGSAVARVLENAVIKDALALGLALAVALLLLRLPRALSGPPLTEEKDSPAPGPDVPITPDSDRLAAFAASYGLSGQELLVMEMLAQRRSTQDIAAAMHVMESTVRNYVARMLKKTAVPNRAALMALFAAQNPAMPEAAEQGEPASR